MIEVIGLHNHIVEFKEGKTLFHSLLVAFSREHSVNGEASANVAKNLNIVKTEEPIGIVYHNCFALAEVDEALHLLFKAIAVVLDCFSCHHLAHICSARGVANHSSTATDKNDGLISCHLQSLHKAESHKVTNVK